MTSSLDLFSFDNQQSTIGELESTGIDNLSMDFDSIIDPSLLELNPTNVSGESFTYPDPKAATTNVIQSGSKNSWAPPTTTTPYAPFASDFSFPQMSKPAYPANRVQRTTSRPTQPSRFVPLNHQQNLAPGGMRPVQRPINPRPNPFYPPPPGFAWQPQHAIPLSRPWSPVPIAPMTTEQNSRRLTSPNQMTSSLDHRLWNHPAIKASKTSSRPRKYKSITRLIDEDESGPEDMALSPADLKSGSRKRKHCPKPSPLSTKFSRKPSYHQPADMAGNEASEFCTSFGQLMSPTTSQRPVRKVRQRNTSNLGSLEAANANANANDFNMDGSFNVPTNVVDLSGIGPLRGNVNTESKEEMMKKTKKARHDYFNSHDEISSPAAEHADGRFVSEIDITTARPRESRRFRHPGRKIVKEQTPETILKNALRRERYRASLNPEQRKRYDREAPK